MRRWYPRLAHLFEPEVDYHAMAAFDETKLNVEETEIYVWVVIDVETLEVTHIEVSLGDLTSMPYGFSSKN